MSVLAIHCGDLHLRAAYMAPLDLPAGVEDGSEPTRFVTPSVVALDAGGPLLGHAALFANGTPRGDRVLWRYRRAALSDRTPCARDRDQQGLTSEAFLGFAALRLASEARGYASVSPDVALVVPDELAADARARLAACAAAQSPARVIGEDDALMATLPPGDATWLVASVDDDALRLRLVQRAGGSGTRLAGREISAAGLGAVRRRWLDAWNAEAALLVPGARAFEEGENPEFERLWQDAWDALNVDAPDPAAVLAVPLVRQSKVLTLMVHVASLQRDLHACVAAAVEGTAALLAEGHARPDRLVVVGPAALRRALTPALAAQAKVTDAQCLGASADAYARGAALLARAGHGVMTNELAAAPYALAVLGLGEDGLATHRPVIAAGTALPATAHFTIVADRDQQKHVSVTLVRQGAEPQQAQRFEFGPLLGNGVQRIGIVVDWQRDGSISARAQDRESGAPVRCTGATELAGGVALASPRSLHGI